MIYQFSQFSFPGLITRRSRRAIFIIVNDAIGQTNTYIIKYEKIYKVNYKTNILFHVISYFLTLLYELIYDICKYKNKCEIKEFCNL